MTKCAIALLALICLGANAHEGHDGDQPNGCAYDWANVPCMVHDLWTWRDADDSQFAFAELPRTRNYRVWRYTDRLVPGKAVAVHWWGWWRNPPSEGEDAKALHAARVLQVLPTVVKAALPTHTALDIEQNDCSQCYRLIQDQQHMLGFRPGWFHYNGMDVPNPDFEEMLLHEMAHAIDNADPYGVDRVSDTGTYRLAADADGAYVSRYADEGGVAEDFAESMLAWAAYHRAGCRANGEAHPVCARVRDAMPNRRKFFNTSMYEAAFKGLPLLHPDTLR